MKAGDFKKLIKDVDDSDEIQVCLSTTDGAELYGCVDSLKAEDGCLTIQASEDEDSEDPEFEDEDEDYEDDEEEEEE